MQIKTTHPTESSAQLMVVADAKELQQIKDIVVGNLASRVKVAGFREGKAPLNLIEKQLDPNVLQTEFLQTAVEELYYQAVTSEKLRPVGNPQLTLSKFVPFFTLEFTAEVPVIGKVTLPDYKKIKLAKPTVKIEAKDITDVLESLRQRAAEHSEVTRAAKTGDQVTIDFVGSEADSGKPVQGAEGKAYPLLLGSNAFIPGFEDNVVGMKPGEEETFVLTFPKDYNVKVLASKKVSFTVKVVKVEDSKLPALDDAFAAKVGPFKSLTELKEDIKRQLTFEKQEQADREYESELVEKITAKAKLTVPAVLIDNEVERLETDEKQNLAYRGQTWQEHLANEGVTAEEHKAQKRPAAEQRLKASLVLAEIAEVEKLDVTPEELEIRLQLLKGQYQDPQMQAELDKPENRRDIAARLLTEKTLGLLVASAS